MTCDQFENQFLADPEAQLSPSERAAGESHRAGCAACQTLARQLQQLDAALTIKVKAPAVSSDFNQRLARRIQIESPMLSEAQLSERKRQLQAEYETGLQQFRHAPLRLTHLLDALPHVVFAALAGWLAWKFSPGMINLLAAQGLAGFSQNLLLAAVAGGVFLATGLAAAFSRPFRQLWGLN